MKPYSGEVCLCLAFVLIGLRAMRATEPVPLALPVWLGVVAAWFSFLALVAMGGAALPLLLAARRSTGRIVQPRMLRIFALWGASGMAALLVAMALTPESTDVFMKASWSIGFPPIPPRSMTDLLWPVTIIPENLRLGGFPEAIPLALIVVAGMVSLAARHGRSALPVLFPLVAAAAAATLRLYPLEGRLTLWETPLVAIFLVVGARWLLELLPSRITTRLSPIALPKLVALPAVMLVRRPSPMTNEDVRPGLERLAARAGAGDAVYVFHGTWNAWQYYSDRLDLPSGKTVLGSCTRADRGQALAEVQRMSGASRLWVVLFPVTTPVRDREMFARFLKGSGARLVEETSRPTRAQWSPRFGSVMLADLRNAELTGATADSLADAIVAQQAVSGQGCWKLFIPASLDRTPRDRFPDPEAPPFRSRERGTILTGAAHSSAVARTRFLRWSPPWRGSLNGAVRGAVQPHPGRVANTSICSRRFRRARRDDVRPHRHRWRRTGES